MQIFEEVHFLKLRTTTEKQTINFNLFCVSGMWEAGRRIQQAIGPQAQASSSQQQQKREEKKKEAPT